MKSKIELIALILVIAAIIIDAVFLIVSFINLNLVQIWVSVIFMFVLAGVANICGSIFS